jgi:ubiquinone/menaquinone biosynthesis C-methylase UbiE
MGIEHTLEPQPHPRHASFPPMKRVLTAEWLDTDAGTPAEVAASLSDLRDINRRFGGIATTEGLIARVVRELNTRTLSLLEVAAGAGDVPRTVGQRFKRRGIQLQVTLLDRALSHLNHGNGQEPQNGTPAVVGDALALPFREESFDVVSCNLFSHHLLPEEVVQFVNEGLRVSRTAVLINDLVRHPLHLTLIYAAMPLFQSRITRHDAVASLRRAYTVEEMRGLLQQTTAARVEIERHYLYRMGALAWK